MAPRTVIVPEKFAKQILVPRPDIIQNVPQ